MVRSGYDFWATYPPPIRGKKLTQRARLVRFINTSSHQHKDDDKWGGQRTQDETRRAMGSCQCHPVLSRMCALFMETERDTMEATIIQQNNSLKNPLKWF